MTRAARHLVGRMSHMRDHGYAMIDSSWARKVLEGANAALLPNTSRKRMSAGAWLMGLQIAGVPGAVAASLGTYLAPILLIGAVANAFHRYYRVVWVRRLEVSLRPLAFGFMASAVFTILRAQLGSQAIVTLVITAFSALLYVRRTLGPMTSIAVSGLAFALLSFGLQLI